MGTLLATILKFLSEIISKVITDALKTPANKTETTTAEGDLPPLPASEYDDVYGVRDPRD